MVSSQQRAAAAQRPGGGFHRMVALQYRDGDYEQSAGMRAANDKAVSSAAAAVGVATPHHRVSQPMFRLVLPSIIMTAKPSSLPKPAPVAEEDDQQQVVMDEYLEYIEQRYSRMHPKHRPQHQKRATHAGGASSTMPRLVLDFHLPRKILLSTLAFYKSPSPLASFGQLRQSWSEAAPAKDHHRRATAANYDRAVVRRTTTDEEEDALNVLGLSSLASARLRQRLHVPRDLRDEYMQLTSSGKSAVNFINHYMHLSDYSPKASSATAAVAAAPTAGTTAASSHTVTKAAVKQVAVDQGGRTSSYASLSFTVQFQLLLATLHRIATAFVHTIKIMTAFSRHLFSAILDKGGFRHSARMMGGASVAVLFMFKPLFNGALKQGGKHLASSA